MTTNNDILIKVEGLKKYFGNNEVLKGINAEIHKGDVMVVIGASGSGKSTFLRCLTCLKSRQTEKSFLTALILTTEM